MRRIPHLQGPWRRFSEPWRHVSGPRLLLARSQTFPHGPRSGSAPGRKAQGGSAKAREDTLVLRSSAAHSRVWKRV